MILIARTSFRKEKKNKKRIQQPDPYVIDPMLMQSVFHSD